MTQTQLLYSLYKNPQNNYFNYVLYNGSDMVINIDICNNKDAIFNMSYFTNLIVYKDGDINNYETTHELIFLNTLQKKTLAHCILNNVIVKDDIKF